MTIFKRFSLSFWSTLVLALIHFPLFAQPLSTYTNLQRRMMVWDNGILRQADYLVPVATKTGRIAIPFIDNARNFKIYYRGGVQQINRGFTNDFDVSDCLITFQNATILSVFDRGKVTKLSNNSSTHYLGDSLVVYYDGIYNNYKYYYDGKVSPLEDFMAAPSYDSNFNRDLAGNALSQIKVSDNIAAYMNYANQFKAIFHGKIIPLEEFQIESFDVGRNTIAYVDLNREFKIFYNGQVTKLEGFPPRKYAAGDGIVAYVTNDGHFKIFYKGEVRDIGFFEPDFKVVDYMVYFDDAGGYFKVFYDGDITTLDTRTPSRIKAKYHSIAFYSSANVLKMFSFGEIYEVTSLQLDDFILDYDVVQYKMGQNMYRIFHKGRDY